MDKIDIIRMARDSGFEQVVRHRNGGSTILPDAMFIRFAELIAASEREKCIEICESLKTNDTAYVDDDWIDMIISAIQKRD